MHLILSSALQVQEQSKILRLQANYQILKMEERIIKKPVIQQALVL